MEGVNGRIAVEDCMPQLVRNDDPLNAVGQITVDYNQFAPRRNQEKTLADSFPLDVPSPGYPNTRRSHTGHLSDISFSIDLLPA
jgi:hypothetical protein